jgi:hypothetical protein
MKRRRKSPSSEERFSALAADASAGLQVKVWLTGISPAAAGLLADVLPIMSDANATTLGKHTLRVAERAETELGEERPCFIDRCPADWARLPIPEGRIVVGVDGGYVRDWERPQDQFRGHRRPVGAGRP